jgi:hypothetical protein
MHGLPQVVAEDRVCLGDPGQGPPDGLADGDASALALIGERPDAAPEPCRARQLSDQPVSLGAGFGVPRLPLVTGSRWSSSASRRFRRFRYSVMAA